MPSRGVLLAARWLLDGGVREPVVGCEEVLAVVLARWTGGGGGEWALAGVVGWSEVDDGCVVAVGSQVASKRASGHSERWSRCLSGCQR